MEPKNASAMLLFLWFSCHRCVTEHRPLSLYTKRAVHGLFDLSFQDIVSPVNKVGHTAYLTQERLRLSKKVYKLL